MALQFVRALSESAYLIIRNNLLKIVENGPLAGGDPIAGDLSLVDGHPTIGYGWDITQYCRLPKSLVMSALAASVMSVLAISPADCRTAPHVLTTKQLKVIVPGHSIGEPYLSYESGVEQFRRDGTYLQLGDNFQDPGTYTIKDSMICIRSESYKSLCRFLLVDNEGQYWLITDLSKKTYHKVVISKH